MPEDQDPKPRRRAMVMTPPKQGDRLKAECDALRAQVADLKQQLAAALGAVHGAPRETHEQYRARKAAAK